MKIFREVSWLAEFEKDIKKLLKRFKTLDEDLEIFIRTELNLYHKLRIDSKGIFQISGLKIESPKIFKAKKFACRSLKGKGPHSGMRVIYAYLEEEDRKENEDKERILKHYRK